MTFVEETSTKVKCKKGKERMTDTKKLKEKIEERGLKLGFIA